MMTTTQPRLSELATHDLHFHYDGSISADVVRRAFRKSGTREQEALARIESTLLHAPVSHPQQFFDTFQKVMTVFDLADGIFPILAAQLEVAHAHGLSHVDLRFGCGSLSNRFRISEDAVLAQFKNAVSHANALGLDVCPTLCFSRYETLDRARHLADFVLENRSFIRAIDLEGQESPNPTEAFASIFQVLKHAGLRITVHAGEFSGPGSIWSAIDACGAERLGHAYSVVDDKVLIRRLAKDKIPVEVCLTSNYLLGLCQDLRSHPLLKFLEAGVPVVLCTDDQALFQTTLAKEYEKAFTVLTQAGLNGFAILENISRNSRLFAFTPEVA